MTKISKPRFDTQYYILYDIIFWCWWLWWYHNGQDKHRFDTYCYIIWHNLPMMILMTRMCQGDGSANKWSKPGERGLWRCSKFDEGGGGGGGGGMIISSSSSSRKCLNWVILQNSLIWTGYADCCDCCCYQEHEEEEEEEEGVDRNSCQECFCSFPLRQPVLWRIPWCSREERVEWNHEAARVQLPFRSLVKRQQ